MRILIYVLADQPTGLGHWYRCQALRDTAERLGHRVALATNYPGVTRQEQYYPVDGLPNGPRLAPLLIMFQPDWVIFDLVQQPESYLRGFIHSYGARSVHLNGVGYHMRDEGDVADVLWVQDDPSRVILRNEISSIKCKSGEKWLVWGGGSDPMNLLPAFSRTMDEPAWLVDTHLTPTRNMSLKAGQEYIRDPGERMVDFMARARKACVATGMIMWEMAALGKQIYLFSKTPLHLHFALKMQATGLALTWPEIGVPRAEEMKKFLAQEYTPCSGNRPDGRGAERLLGVLEKYG